LLLIICTPTLQWQHRSLLSLPRKKWSSSSRRKNTSTTSWRRESCLRSASTSPARLRSCSASIWRSNWPSLTTWTSSRTPPPCLSWCTRIPWRRRYWIV